MLTRFKMTICLALILLGSYLYFYDNNEQVTFADIQKPNEAQREFTKAILPVKEQAEIIITEEIFNVPLDYRLYPEYEGIINGDN